MQILEFIFSEIDGIIDFIIVVIVIRVPSWIIIIESSKDWIQFILIHFFTLFLLLFLAVWRITVKFLPVFLHRLILLFLFLVMVVILFNSIWMIMTIIIIALNYELYAVIEIV